MAENEMLDLSPRGRWYSLLKHLRNAPTALRVDEAVQLIEKRMCAALRRVQKLCPFERLIQALCNGSLQEVQQIKQEHHLQRDRCDAYIELCCRVCRPGMAFHDAVSGVLHGVFSTIADQLSIPLVPSENFPTYDAVIAAIRQWEVRMQPRIQKLVKRIEESRPVRSSPRSRAEKVRQLDQHISMSLL